MITIVCPKCSPEAWTNLHLSGYQWEKAKYEVDPKDGWRRFRILHCPECQGYMELFVDQKGIALKMEHMLS